MSASSVTRCPACGGYEAYNCDCGKGRDSNTPPPNGHKANGPKARIVAAYDYRDRAGAVVYQSVRMEPKDFRQRRPNGNGGWTWNLQGVSLVLYRQPQLLSADTALPVVVVEGEKDADRLAGLGFTATTNAMGAGKWRDAYSEALRGRDVVILPDNDLVGCQHAEEVARSLHGTAATLKVIKLDGLRDHGDVSDWLAAGHTADELRALIDATAPWVPRTGQSSSSSSSASAAWEEPIPLMAHVLPAYPVDALPSWLAAQVKDVATFTQTPPDLAAMIGTSVLAVPCAKKVRVEVKAGYTEPVNVYTATAMIPGSRKTSVFEAMVAPLEEYEEEQARQMEADIAEARTRYDILEAALHKAKADAAKAKQAEREALTKTAADLARTLATLKVPEAPRLIADDCSPEKVASLLHDHGGRMALMSPEGDVFDLMAGRYGNGPNLGVYLKGHAGDTLHVDRVGRPAEYVRQPALTIGLAVQPDVLAGLMAKPGFRGRGLLGRFLYSLPPNLMGTRDTTAPPIPARTKDAYRDAVRALLKLPFDEDQNGQPATRILKLGPGARERMADFEAWVEPQLVTTGALGGMTDWGGKLVGAVARISALLHMAEYAHHAAPWSVPIEASTVENAVKIGRYAMAHAKAAYALMGSDAAIDGAGHVLAWIESKQRTRFSQRDAFRALQGRFERMDGIKAALAVLEERGYIREQPQEQRQGAGRPASPRYDVNPWVHAHPDRADFVNVSIMSEGAPGENDGSAGNPDLEEVRI